VAAQSPNRLRRLVYLDAFIPEDGQSALDLLPEAIQTSFREQARVNGDGWRLPASEGLLDMWGLAPGSAREYVRERLCEFSLRCFEQRIRIPRDVARLTRTFVASVADHYPARAVFGRFAEKARQQGWKYHELPTGHDCHVEATQALASILLDD
jgi:pimeloyl-ACP methyl ester carboxylesterase